MVYLKEYLDEDKYLEDLYGDEIKVGDSFYRYSENYGSIEYLIHEKNFIQFAEDELDVKKEER